MRKWLAGVLLIISMASFLQGCTRAKSAESTKPISINVFAAASLTEAFQALGQMYSRENSAVMITFNFAGSQQLAQQISLGAAADVFASADQAQMDVVVRQGEVDSSQVVPFASNQLAVVLPKDNPGEIEHLQDLAKPGIKLILCAQGVPAGDYAREFLIKASRDPQYGFDFSSKAQANIVSYEESVKSVLSKIRLGEGDAGIVYVSDAKSAEKDVHKLDIPEALNVKAIYPIAVLKNSANPQATQGFIKFILSPTGQAILQQYGFEKPVS